MNTPPTVALQEWEAARQRLLVKEKELTRARDALRRNVGACPGYRSRRTICSTGRTAG